MDKDFIPGLMYIRDNEAASEEFEAMSLPFTVPSASGQDVQLSSKHTHITLDNRAEYVRLAMNYRWVGAALLCVHSRKSRNGGGGSWQLSCAVPCAPSCLVPSLASPEGPEDSSFQRALPKGSPAGSSWEGGCG